VFTCQLLPSLRLSKAVWECRCDPQTAHSLLPVFWLYPGNWQGFQRSTLKGAEQMVARVFASGFSGLRDVRVAR
jgi:hypothetical protein